MSNDLSYTPRRPRMDPDAYRRIMAEVSHLGRPDTAEIATTTEELRDILLQPIEDEPEADTASVEAETPAAAPVATPVSDRWDALGRVAVKSKTLDRNLVITANRSDPAYASFDVLRTRLVQALKDKGWKRVAITSPTAGCGKSFTALNLAMTLSRYESCRTLLMDMDLRRPALAKYLGLRDVGSMGDMLRGDVTAADHLKRIDAPDVNIGENLALGLNRVPEAYAAELIHKDKTRDILEQVQSDYDPDVILYDLPPALAQDDVISFRPYFDCVLLVVGGGITTAKEIQEVNRRIGDDKPVLGVVLNMAEDTEASAYVY